jgi:hypothetical protein
LPHFFHNDRRFLMTRWSCLGCCVAAALVIAGATVPVRAADRELDALEEWQDVPLELHPPAGQQLVLVARGQGVQIYDCVDRAWQFREPAAVLARRHHEVGIHFRGPAWELFDGSSFQGRAMVTVPAPNPRQDIPLLLLERVATAGDGTLRQVDFVQRLWTRGGVAPAGSCTPGATVAIPYTALYTFFSSSPLP